MSFRRPSLPKINRKVPKPKKSLRKLKQKSVRPSRISKRPPTTKLPQSKKKKSVHLGICYSGLNCTGKILLRKSTKGKCKDVGGKSWRTERGCEQIKSLV
jgi:NH3-dependent NAD+ synthetase